MDRRNDFKRFGLVMSALQEWAGLPASGTRTEIYFRALEDLSIEEIEKAAWHIIGHRTTASFPKPGELREAITGKVEDLAQLAVALIEKAWSNGLDSGCNVNFHDSLLHECINSQGGWVELCRAEDWQFRKKDIAKLYVAFRHSGRKPETNTEPLWGDHGSIENRQMIESRGLTVKIYHIDMKSSIVKVLPYKPVEQIGHEMTNNVLPMIKRIGGGAV